MAKAYRGTVSANQASAPITAPPANTSTTTKELAFPRYKQLTWELAGHTFYFIERAGLADFTV